MSAMRLDHRHDRPLELAALAIDFDLTAAESAELEAHLAGCAACARRVAALRTDARTLARPLTLLPSARVDAAVAAAIAGRQPRAQRIWLLAAAALLLLAMLGAVAVGAYLLSELEDLPTTVTPTQPVAVDSPGPKASPAVIGETWQTMAFDATQGGLIEAITFDGADLVGVGRGGCVTDSDGAGECVAAAWTATEGQGWSRAVDQRGLQVGLGHPTSGPETGIFDVANGPAGLVAIGYDNDPLPGSCPVAPCTSGPAVWRSQDGRTWERVQVDLGPGFIDTYSEPIAAIAAGPDGYVMVGYAIGLSPTGDTEARATAWASPDGISWTRAAHSEDLTLGGCVDTGEQPSCGGMKAVVSTPSGFVAVGYRNEGGSTQTPAAWTSPDGLSWTLTMAGLDFEGDLASVAFGPAGVVAGGTICSPQECFGASANLTSDGTWQVLTPRTDQGMAGLGRLTATEEAYFGLTWRADELALWRSADGAAWQRVGSLPTIPDPIGYRGVDLDATPDRVVVAGWAEVTGADNFQNFAYASPPWPLPAEGEALPARIGQFGDAATFGGPRLVSQSAGWFSTGHGFFRTEDMGKTWTAVRPPGWSATAAELVAAVDGETMYAALPGPPVTIAATHDGGVTWVQATIDDASIVGIPNMSFQSPDDGSAWFMANDEKELRTYHTADGGRSWTGPVRSKLPDLPIETNGINGPIGGALWISNGKADDKPFDNTLFLSMDGGGTWMERSFPIGSEAPKTELKTVDAIWADGSGGIVMVVSLGGGPLIYRSEDDGRTWRFVRSVAKSGGVHLLSATEWVLMAYDGSEVWSTLDGGNNWRKVEGASRIYLQYSSFASPDHGWAIHECPREGRSPVPGPDPYCDGTGLKQVFMTTVDGGRTWTQLGE